MHDTYVFRKIKAEEVPHMFAMILKRMKWMDEKGIEQWNVTRYDEVYPLSYYKEKQEKGQAFVLYDTASSRIICAGVLLDQDDRWPDNPPAFYLHHFVTEIGAPGVGRIFIRHAETYAAEQGKCFFRLDSAVDNVPLARYYDALGYSPVGTCVDGLYEGILREKRL